MSLTSEDVQDFPTWLRQYLRSCSPVPPADDLSVSVALTNGRSFRYNDKYVCVNANHLSEYIRRTYRRDVTPRDVGRALRSGGFKQTRIDAPIFRGKARRYWPISWSGSGS